MMLFCLMQLSDQLDLVLEAQLSLLGPQTTKA